MSIRPRLTYANVVSTVALILALAGSTAYASAKITSSQIAPRSIKARQLAPKAVKSGKIAPRAVRSRHIAAGAVNGRQIVAGAVGPFQLAHSAVGSKQIAPGAVGNRELGTAAVDGSKVRDGSLSPADILGGAEVVARARSSSAVELPPSLGEVVTVPLQGGTWAQGAAQVNLFAVRIAATFTPSLEPCGIRVSISDEEGVLESTDFTSEGPLPQTVDRQSLLESVRLGSGKPTPRELAATVEHYVPPKSLEPCESATVEAVEVAVLGVG